MLAVPHGHILVKAKPSAQSALLCRSEAWGLLQPPDLRQGGAACPGPGAPPFFIAASVFLYLCDRAALALAQGEMENPADLRLTSFPPLRFLTRQVY